LRSVGARPVSSALTTGHDVVRIDPVETNSSLARGGSLNLDLLAVVPADAVSKIPSSRAPGF